MALEDSHPERRNLTLISLALIAYYFGGGSFFNDQVNLFVVSASFSNTTVLAWMVWLIFLWSIWRYWVSTKGELRSSLLKEIATIKISGRAHHYIRELSAPLKLNKGIYLIPGHIDYKNFSIRVIIHFNDGDGRSYPLNESINGGLQNLRFRKKFKVEDEYSTQVVFSGLLWFKYSLPIFRSLILKYPSLTGYTMPYFLALLAISGAALSLVSQNC